MDDLDRRLQEALRGEDREIFAGGDPGLTELIAGTLRGRLRVLTMLGWGMTLAFFVLQVWSAVRFFAAGSLEDKLLWATSFLFFGLGVAMLKVWGWLEMGRYATIREIKRLELQVARLAGRIGGPSAPDR